MIRARRARQRSALPPVARPDRRPTHRALAVIGLIAAVASTAGCSQVAQLRGVAGGQVSAVRTATNDVLVEKKVDIGVAPVCGFADPLYTCAGTTADGRPITSSAEVRAEFGASTGPSGVPAPADVSLVVTVDGATLYDGTVEDVLTRNGQVS